MERFVVCGEALIDLIATDFGNDTLKSTWAALSAGGPMNTAIALARQGETVQFLGRLGGDSFGGQIKSHLEANKLGLDLLVEAHKDATSLAIVSLDDQGKASYTFHFDGTANFGWQDTELPDLTQDDWLHIGSLPTVIEPGSRALLRWAKGTPAALSYDVNVRPTVMPDRREYWRKVEPWLKAVGNSGGILKASDEDIDYISEAGGYEGNALEVAVEWARAYDPALVVVTLGADGVAAIKRDGRKVQVPGFKIDLVDTVGAGDTFMAGFLSAYTKNPEDLKTALTRGAASAAIVCSRQGANPPTTEELEQFLADNA